VFPTPQRVGGARAIKEACEMFPKGKTWSSIVLPDAWSGACRYIYGWIAVGN